MSAEQKPREWWINKCAIEDTAEGAIYEHPPVFIQKSTAFIHVIEHAAYKLLEAEVAAIKARMLDYKNHPETTILVCDQTIEGMSDEIAALTAELKDWRAGAESEARAGDEARAEVKRLAAENEELRRLIPETPSVHMVREQRGRAENVRLRKALKFAKDLLLDLTYDNYDKSCIGIDALNGLDQIERLEAKPAWVIK